MIRLEHIVKSFRRIQAVADVSFTVRPGTITILTGADGAGKSTLFKIIIGLVKQDAGAVFLNDKELKGDFSPITSIAGYMPERFSLYTDLTVEENLNFFAAIHHVERRRREELKQKLLQTTGMLPFKKRRAGALSGGMKQKLALSTILLASPQLIILDEPTTGVDPLSRIEFFAIIEELKREGKTILISTPYLDEAEKGDFVIFIKNGRVIRQDGIASLKKNFPARIWRITPKGNPFAILEKAAADPELRRNLLLRGQYLKFLQTDPAARLPAIPHLEIREEKATLEDIYIYYERQAP